MRRSAWRAAAAATGLSALAACGAVELPLPDSAAASPSAVVTAPAPRPTVGTPTLPEPAPNASPTASPGSEASPPVPTPAPTPGPIESEDSALAPQAVSLQHPNGVTVTVLRTARRADGVAVNLVAYNPTATEIELAAEGDHAILVDDTGVTHELVPPPDNETLAIEPGGTLTGTLVFADTLTTEATALRLVLNGLASDRPTPLDSEPDDTTAPRFDFAAVAIGR